MTDKERMDWLEVRHGLHSTVEILYVVDGYEITKLYDDRPMSSTVRGATLREAIDAMVAYEGGGF